MKFTTCKSDLRAALTRVSGAVARSSTLPILFSVLVRAKSDGVEIVGNNLDFQITTQLKAEVSQQGEGALPFSRLAALANVLGSEIVEISANDKHCATITAAGASCTLFGLDAADFPNLKVNGTKSLKVPQSALASMIRKVQYAASDDTNRFTINSVLLKAENGAIAAVSTDGQRLSLCSLDNIPTEDFEMILPTRTADQLAVLLSSKGESEATLSFGSNFIEIDVGETRIISKLIEGNYPNFKMVIPKDHKESVALDREEFIETMRRLFTMSDEAEFRPIDFTLAKNSLRFCAEGKQGSVVDSLAVKYVGDPITIRINGVFIFQAVSALDDDEIQIELIDDLSPVVIKAANFKAVIMPLRPK